MTKIKEFKLPFAKNFDKFLRSSLEGTLELETIEANAEVNDGRVSRYCIIFNNQTLGEFRVYRSNNLFNRLLGRPSEIVYYGNSPMPGVGWLNDIKLLFSNSVYHWGAHGDFRVEKVKPRRMDHYSSIPFP